MKKIIALILIVVSVSFAVPTFYGTRGTNFVSSALCENMGFLWFYISSEGYMEDVTFQDSSGVVQNTYSNMAAKPIVSIGFTPWHYLEFSVYGSAYFYLNQDNSVSAYGLTDVGGHVKGSIPLVPIDDPDRTLKMALGIDGFFLMSLPFELDAAANANLEQYLGYYPFDQAGPEFGGKLLYSLESRFISGHLNAGYWYRSTHTQGTATLQYPQTILGGVGIESNPWPWLNPFVDFSLNYGLDMGGADPTLVGITTNGTVGLRFPLMMGKRKGFGLLFTLAGGADPMNFSETMSLYAGIGIGGDLIQPKEKYLEGIVLDAETGDPIVGAQVTVSGPDRDTTITLVTDSLGEFSLSEKDLLETDSLYVTAEDYHPESRPPDELEVILASKEEIALEMAMERMKHSYIAGVVSDISTSQPMLSTIRMNEINTGQILPALTTDAITGYFRTEVPSGTYRVRTSATGYHEDEFTIDIDIGQDTIVDIFLTKIAEPKPVELPPLTLTGFGKGDRRLSFQQIQELERVADMMAANPDATVVLTGHTDSVGSDGTNIRVGEQRALAVAEFLTSRGIDSRRIRIASGGERFPLADNRYRSGRAANRRVEMAFQNVPKGGAEPGGGKPPREKVK